jgi:8-oxo-dGTP diphosphatase
MPIDDMSGVRLSVKAIIVRDGQLLALKCRDDDDDGDWYMLPGGGQSNGETVSQALERECFEETGCTIRVGSLRFVRDYIARNHEFAHSSGDFHAVELWFECELVSGPGAPTQPDTPQIGIEWLALSSIDSYRLYPKVLRAVLVGERSDTPVLLGDVN